MIFQSNRHKQIFEAGRLNLHKPSNQTLAELYLLTADHMLCALSPLGYSISQSV